MGNGNDDLYGFPMVLLFRDLDETIVAGPSVLPSLPAPAVLAVLATLLYLDPIDRFDRAVPPVTDGATGCRENVRVFFSMVNWVEMW